MVAEMLQTMSLYGCPEKFPPEKGPLEKCPRENYPSEISSPRKLPPGKLFPWIFVAFNPLTTMGHLCSNIEIFLHFSLTYMSGFFT